MKGGAGAPAAAATPTGKAASRGGADRGQGRKSGTTMAKEKTAAELSSGKQSLLAAAFAGLQRHPRFGPSAGPSGAKWY